jgi:receptor protein-tyrosine kinase
MTQSQIASVEASADGPRTAREELHGDEHRRTIGAILIEGGCLSSTDADRVSHYASEKGLRFGEAAVQLRLVAPADVQAALAQQFRYPILKRGGDSGVADDVIAAYNPQCDMVEPLRILRSQLTLRWRHAPGRKALAITSPARADGRSWLAANLAAVFAQGGDRTLLIDTDMRHPVQHRLFNVDNSVGLSALLTGRALARDVVRRIHPALRLFVLSAGILPPNPQELLVRPAFDTMLLRLAETFDVVILDTPAATETADAQILSARAGAAVILARRHRTRVVDLTETMTSLCETGVNVVGSVVTDH